MSIKKESLDQVPLFELLFSLNWEDPRLDLQALQIQSGDRVFAITSGCCNILEFLLHDPSVIYAVDINPTQTYLMELKIQAIRHLPYQEFLNFLGISPSENRPALFEQFKQGLSEDCRLYWEKHPVIIRNGVFFSGRFEKLVEKAGRMIRFLQGSQRVRTFFDLKDMHVQKDFFRSSWNTRRVKLIFNLLFNKRTLAKRGLSADYFHFDDGSTSFAQNFYNRYVNAVRDIPVYNNYFLSLYIQGKYNSMNELPECYKEMNYDIIKKNVDKIQLYTSDAQQWFDTMESRSIDCFALSNICELMSLNDTTVLFNAVFRTSKHNARIIFRNLIVPREVPEVLRNSIIKNESLSKELLKQDRSFVYAKVNAYQITHETE
jgi:S-adenosylmethionine-diacylglycerol 3-amino-3-carboxypropyl transferase